MSRRSVLLIDDDQTVRKSLTAALKIEGFTVHSAENGRVGLDLIPTVENIGLIILDLMMPVMDGLEFLEIRKTDHALSKIPVVIFSAYPEKAAGIEAEGSLRKPPSLDALYEVVRKFCL